MTLAVAGFVIAVARTADAPVAFSVMGVVILVEAMAVSLSVVVIGLLPRRVRAVGDVSWLNWWASGMVHAAWRESPRGLLIFMGSFGIAVFGVDLLTGLHENLESARGLQGAALGAAMLALLQVSRG